MGDKLNIEGTRWRHIVPRSVWGAEPPMPEIEAQGYTAIEKSDSAGLDEILRSELKRIVVHHSAWRPWDSPAFIQKWAMGGGYDDIPYHFYITEDGTIYEGRDLKHVGAHAGISVEAELLDDIRLDPDYGSIGIAVAGCFDPSCVEQHEPTAEQLDALAWLVLSLRNFFPEIGPRDVMGHQAVRERVIMDQGLTPAKSYETACPGMELDAWTYGIATLMENAAASAHAASKPIRPFIFMDSKTQAIVRGVRFRPAEVGLTIIAGAVSKFADRWSALGESGAMINGGYFGEEFEPKGFLWNDGIELAPFEDGSPYSGIFAVAGNGDWGLSYLRKTGDEFVEPEDIKQNRFALQAGPMVIEPGGKDGIPEPKEKGQGAQRSIVYERTAIAASRSGEWYFVATEPMTLFDLQTALRSLIPDVDAAMNLDGGPSTALAAEGFGIMVLPKGLLPVMLHIGQRE